MGGDNVNTGSTEAVVPAGASPREAMNAIIQRIATGPELSKDISREDARLGMELVLQKRVDPVQGGVFLIALRMKRETDEENLGLLDGIRGAVQGVQAEVEELVDLADPYNGYNRTLPVSPLLPAVLAACGVAVVSHGVASMGPKFGATHHQVLAALGVAVDLTPDQAAARVADPALGWAYVDQAQFCPALHGLAGLRTLIVKRPAITTVEVLAKPISGRRSTHLVTGFVHKPYPRIYALLARQAGFESALLVRGTEGGVIPSLRQKSLCWAYRNLGDEYSVTVTPQEPGIEQTVRAAPLPEWLPGYSRKSDLAGARVDAGAMARCAAEAGEQALQGEPGPVYDGLVYGGALVLHHLQRCSSLAQAARQVRQAIDTGKALERLHLARQAGNPKDSG